MPRLPPLRAVEGGIWRAHCLLTTCIVLYCRCGPCKALAPELERMSSQYQDVVFLKAEEKSGAPAEFGIRAYPTLKFYLGGAEKHEVRGANVAEIRSTIERLRGMAFSAFSGGGHSLASSGGGGASAGGSAADVRAAREARLKFFEKQAASAPAAAAAPEPAAAAAPEPPSASAEVAAPAAASAAAAAPAAAASGGGDADDPELAAAIAASLASAADDVDMEKDDAADGGGGGDAPGEAPTSGDGAVATAVPVVDEELFKQLGDMGFSQMRALKALHYTNNADLESAVNWIMEHQEDPDIDEPLVVPTAAVAAGADTSGSPKRPMTAEEKKAKARELQALARAKREAKERAYEEEKRQREIVRRKEAQQVGAMQDDIQALIRKREREQQRKEKEDARKERERLRREIAIDKAERAAARGGAGAVGTVTTVNEIVKKEKTPEERMNAATRALCQFRVENKGLTALKTLRVLVNNALTKDDEKFRRVNLENAKIQERVTSVTGGTAFLKACGFVKSDTERALVLTDKDDARLTTAVGKLDDAIEHMKKFA